MKGSKVLLLVVIVVLLLLVFWIIAARKVHYQGRNRPSMKEVLTSSTTLFAPYNWWCMHASKGGNSPHPSMSLHFPNVNILRKNWKSIRNEARMVTKEGLLSRINTDRFFTTIADDKWKKFYIKWYSDILPEARQLCPKTCALIDKLPEVQLAMFSVLGPGGRITPHSGPFKGALRYHLGLECTEDANIVVDGSPYTWKCGKDILFDDTYIHEVSNDSATETRVILFCDIVRQMSTPSQNRINEWVCRNVAPFANKVNNRTELQSKQ